MKPKLYIIMREDLYDNSPGKMMAQSAHAQADFDTYVENHYTDNDFRSAHIQWCAELNFGVTLVLHEPLLMMEEIQDFVKHSGMTVDPTYPYRNHYGKMFAREEVTCMWAFATTDEEVEYMQQYKLHC